MFDDKYYMNLALDLARTGIGYTSPNPCVGSVIVKNGQIIGTGAHLQAGLEHAEVAAIQMAGKNASGSTLYVTLEPCNHHGKTPPCTEAIINSGISRVIVATLDPNPLVSGKGIKALEDAGIAVEIGLLQEEADKLNDIFFHYISTRTPFITLKCGMSLDAKLATKNMESKWITNSSSRSDAHYYRHTHDAILVGINTILADNPSLTYRGELPSSGKLVRIILDTHLRTPLDAKIVTDKSHPTWIIIGNNVTPAQIAKYSNVKIIQMKDNHIDLVQLMKQLGELQITSILVEGGHTVLTSFLELGLFNQIVAYIAPLLIGGKSAPGLFMGEGFGKLSDALKLKYEHVQIIDNDLKLVLNKDRHATTRVCDTRDDQRETKCLRE
ncbi:MAG TPA: bifunctional diaminohydroxyphosphoribosylaminopyrimidine deaminase/5-amino-6-(5-phosphoribosylamino)uracil reductase RibD [Aquella sp.]|nr:bifunctional diaminohydroxyphosphoribosylaminopyrimidine deaminase/5-amino-6-(5-phosphoribosylamino)uracil reductase RibD [Aquella sp.]